MEHWYSGGKCLMKSNFLNEKKILNILTENCLTKNPKATSNSGNNEYLHKDEPYLFCKSFLINLLPTF
jgi:hypothetical protein